MHLKSSRITFLFLVLNFVLTCCLNASVLWYADPNKPLTTVFYRLDMTGFTTGATCVDDSNNPSIASTPTDSIYGKHWMMYKPAGRKRGEFARTNGLIFNDGDDYYLGWRFYISSTPTITKGMSIFQWKTDSKGGAVDTQNYPFSVVYDGTYLSINCYGPGTPDWTAGLSIGNRKTTIWKKAVTEGEWKSIEFHLKVSSDPKIGYIEFWYNDEKQVLSNINCKEYQVTLSADATKAYHKTFDGNTVYTKWGPYGGGTCDFNVAIHYDELRVATTFDEARPSFYEPVPTVVRD